MRNCSSCWRRAAGATTVVDTMPPLFQNQAEYDAFTARHNTSTPPQADIATYTGDAYLGIDAGSTTTKMALITPDGGLLYTYYHSNLGNPVAIVLEQLKEIYKLLWGPHHHKGFRRHRLRGGPHQKRFLL